MKQNNNNNIILIIIINIKIDFEKHFKRKINEKTKKHYMSTRHELIETSCNVFC